MATDLLLSVANQNRFALRLAAAVSSAGNAASSAGNAAFSPLSLHVALSLVAAGAGGATRDQLADVLGAGGTDELYALGAQVVELVLADASGAGGPRVAFADSIFVDESLSLKPLFKEIAAGKYKAETRSVDFQTKAAEVINQVNLWVENITSGLIKELLPPGSVDRSTRLVLGNALYFKGVWTEKFNASETENGEFHLLHGSSVQVPFMTSTNDQYLSCYNNLKVLRLPYKQGEDERQFSMYMLLPEARDGLWSLAQKLSSGPEFLENHLPTQKVEVRRVMVPKFKISFGFEASNLFKGLGLQLPFGADADLSEMVDSPLSQNLCVSSIFQKSFVEVNEEGTEAAAASAVVMRLVSLSLTSKYFVADHPFLFLIREEKTGVVLFIGHVLNPLLVP